jgi:hydroxymethylglutaryl-CoA reductase (NADPH)
MMSSISFHISDASLTETEKLKQRQSLTQKSYPSLFTTPFDPELVGKKNCENLIGSVAIPVGVAGPMLLHGDVLEEEVFFPLATTEGALVASVQRGSKAVSQSGGATVMVKKVGITRAPVFKCQSGKEAALFVQWLENHQTEIAEYAEETSSHLKYLSHESWVRGRHVYVRFVFDTEEAMGMNMASIAVQHVWKKIREQVNAEMFVEMISLTSNVCSDKKDSMINRLYGRGYWVQAEAVLSEEVLRSVLKTTAEKLVATHVAKNLVGSNIAGSFSQNMHVGNTIAALYASTGQDLAHITEGSQAATTIEQNADGSVYVSLTLPNVVVGTVGGGTSLPAQTEARLFIREGKEISAKQLAGVIGAAALAGEVSGLSALSVNALAQAHQKLGRIHSSKES